MIINPIPNGTCLYLVFNSTKETEGFISSVKNMSNGNGSFDTKLVGNIVVKTTFQNTDESVIKKLLDEISCVVNAYIEKIRMVVFNDKGGLESDLQYDNEEEIKNYFCLC